MTVRKRVRHRPYTCTPPDIRSMRLALGLSVDDAAQLTHENRGLLQSQETAGSNADGEFVSTVMAAYVDHARYLPATATVAADPLCVRYMRLGVGLSDINAACEVLPSTAAVVRAAEAMASGWSAHDRGVVWSAYLDWYRRMKQRSERARPIREERSTIRMKAEQAQRESIESEIREQEARIAVARFLNQ